MIYIDRWYQIQNRARKKQIIYDNHLIMNAYTIVIDRQNFYINAIVVMANVNPILKISFP